MTAILGISAIAAVAVFGFWLVVIWARTYATDLGASSRYLDTYYAAAQKLTKDPNTPTVILEFIDFFSAHAGRPPLARNFAWHMLRGNLSGDKHPLDNDFSRALAGLKPEQARAFADMVAYGMAASASADPILSRVFLRMLNLMVSVSGRSDDEPSVQRVNTVAMDINRAQPAHAMA